MLVVDASVSLAWAFPDEKQELAERVLELVAEEGAFVPAIWALEVANALIVAERRGRLTRPQSARALALLGQVPVRISPPTPESDFGRVMALARSCHLSSYDAAYLELAERANFPLATLDGRLMAAAIKTGVPVVR
jgi:predicted nucleic acid-binding protein